MAARRSLTGGRRTLLSYMPKLSNISSSSAKRSRLDTSVEPPESSESAATDSEVKSTESSDPDQSDSHSDISLCGLGLASPDNEVSTEFEQQQSNFVTVHKPSGPTTIIVNPLRTIVRKRNFPIRDDNVTFS